jgi:hypothetical protein
MPLAGGTHRTIFFLFKRIAGNLLVLEIRWFYGQRHALPLSREQF